jgi:lysozyme
MSIEGVDVSNHQATFDFRGWQFAIIKCSEGNNFTDFRFWQHVNAARAAGLLIAAYHYQRDVSAQSQFDLIRSIVPVEMPVIIDVEDGSGSLNITRELIRLLREAGYSVPLLYLPRWYWINIGRPSLTGLPPLWGSDYRGGSADWSDYGGLPVALRQYTSTPFDKSWFDGTREEFAALLGSDEGEDEMAFLDEEALTLSNGVVITWRELFKSMDRNGTETRDRVRDLGDEVADLREAVAKIQTGGVSKEEIAEIAKDAIADDLNDGEE